MPSILAIDAAWSGKNPSGVALLTYKNRSWHCLAVAPSYEAFIGIATGKMVDWKSSPKGGKPHPVYKA